MADANFAKFASAIKYRTMKAREIIFTIFIAIALPLVALLSIFLLKGNDAPAPASNSFPYVAPVNLPSLKDQTKLSEAAPPKITQPEQKSSATALGVEQVGQADVLSAVANVAKKTTESWNDFIARFYPTPASLPATSPLGNFYVGGIATPDPFPLRNWQVPLQDIDGWAVISTEVPENKVLYEKDIFTPHPIASISKLMTGLVAAENLPLDEKVAVSQKAVDTEGDEGGLVVGETLTVKQLLYAMLLESSNDAAVALAQDFDLHHAKKPNTFIVEMNKKAQELNLGSMAFQDPTGLTPANVSNAQDVAQLMFTAYQNQTLGPILGTPEYDAQSEEGFKHHWVSTDSLLGQIPGVVAGKTGFLNEAGQCLVVVSNVSGAESPKTVVSVILGSGNRMQAMATLLSWIQSAYSWQQ